MKAPRPVRFLVFGAALRDGSLNSRLAALAADVIEWQGGEAIVARMQDFECPLYDDDLAAHGAPDGVQLFRELLSECDGLVVSSPEYNGSMPGILKNLIDWSSRYYPHPFDGRHALLLSASPSMMGGNRGLWALRVPLEHLGMRVYPEMFSLAQANEAFDADDRIKDSATANRFEQLIDSFMGLVEAAKYYRSPDGGQNLFRNQIVLNLEQDSVPVVAGVNGDDEIEVGDDEHVLTAVPQRRESA